MGDHELQAARRAWSEDQSVKNAQYLTRTLVRIAGWRPGRDCDGPERRELMQVASEIPLTLRKKVLSPLALFCRAPLEHAWAFDEILHRTLCVACGAAGQPSLVHDAIVEISG